MPCHAADRCDCKRRTAQNHLALTLPALKLKRRPSARIFFAGLRQIRRQLPLFPLCHLQVSKREKQLQRMNAMLSNQRRNPQRFRGPIRLRNTTLPLTR